MNITIHRDGQNFGPYTLDQVKEYLASGQLQLSDLAFCEGATEWVPLVHIPGLNTSPPPPRTPPPPPPPLLKQLPIPSRAIASSTAPASSSSNVLKSCTGCIGTLFAIIIGLSILIAIVGGNKSSSSNITSAQSDLPIPAQQKAFSSMIDSFITSYNNADSEVQKTNLRFERKDAIRNFFTSTDGRIDFRFDSWVGQVKQMTTDTDGKAYLSIQLADKDITIETNTDTMSDVLSLSKTMMTRDQDIYKSLLEIKVGDTVIVSGEFLIGLGNDYIQEISLTESGSMTGPEFIVKFSQIHKL